MPTTLSEQDLKKLARLGAVARLKELEDEIKAIRRMFPGLRDQAPARQADVEAPAAAPRRKRKNRMSKEARERQSARMRTYWAERRAAKASANGGETATAETGAKKPRRPRRKSR